MSILMVLVSSSSLPSTPTKERTSTYLNCGKVKLCGVLALESGFGKGYYQHQRPSVHGLWPETGEYGTSACVPPLNVSSPQTIFPCYKDANQPDSHLIEFEQHEWKKHGLCSGVKDANDFFTQICSISADPILVMSKSRSSGKTATADVRFPILSLPTQPE